MPVSRSLWFSIGCLWASSCVLDRTGSFEPNETSGGGPPTECDADADCAGTTCRPSRCVDGTCTDEVAPRDAACSDDGGSICDGMGHCVREDGTPCGSGAQCSSGFCADGVCCDVDCTDACESCLITGNEGTCTPFAASTDPELDCAGDGICDGSSNCAVGSPLGISAQYGDSFDQLGTAVAVDANGARFVTAAFVNSITFATVHVGAVSNLDFAIAKISAEGVPLWSRHFPGTGTDVALSIAVSSSGQVFVAGQFDAQLAVGTSVLTSAGLADMFILKLDAAGNLAWSRRFGTAGVDTIAEIDVKDDGNVVLTGIVSGPVSLDGGATTLPFAGARDIVAAELAGTDGALLWGTSMGGPASDEGRAITIDEDDNVYVSGLFAATAAFGPNVFTATGDDAFLVKLDAGGEQAWAIQLGGTLNEVGRALDATDAGLVLAGDFTGTISLAGGQWTSADALSDVFVARFDENGSAVWAGALEGAASQHAHELDIDASGNVILAGTMGGTANSGAVVLVSAGLLDAYLLKLADDGTPLWGERFGDAQDQSCDGVAFDENGNAVATGWFRGSIDFGDGNPHVSAGLTDMFLMARTP